MKSADKSLSYCCMTSNNRSRIHWQTGKFCDLQTLVFEIHCASMNTLLTSNGEVNMEVKL